MQALCSRRILATPGVPWAPPRAGQTRFMQRRYAEAEILLKPLVSENRLYVDLRLAVATREGRRRANPRATCWPVRPALSPHRVGHCRLGELSIATGDPMPPGCSDQSSRKGKIPTARPRRPRPPGPGPARPWRHDQAEATIRDLERSMAASRRRACARCRAPWCMSEGRDRAGPASKTLIAESGRRPGPVTRPEGAARPSLLRHQSRQGEGAPGRPSTSCATPPTGAPPPPRTCSGGRRGQISAKALAERINAGSPRPGGRGRPPGRTATSTARSQFMLTAVPQDAQQHQRPFPTPRWPSSNTSGLRLEQALTPSQARNMMERRAPKTGNARLPAHLPSADLRNATDQA